jgi:hypothetical protein
VRLTILLAAIGLIAGSARAQDANQTVFLRAMQLMESSQPLQAAEQLERLYAETGAPRVRLELARAYYAANNHTKARELFVAAYEDNPPPPVRMRIRSFINEIDRQRGKLSLGASFTKAQNPMRLPNQFGIDFNGSTLTLDQNPKQKNIYGVIYNGAYEKQFGSDKDLRVQGSFRDLEHSFGDFGFLDASVGLRPTPLPAELRIGFQFLEMKAQSYRMPYLEAAYHISISDEIGFVPRLQVGAHERRNYKALSGTAFKITLPFEFSFNAHRSFSIGVRAERRTADLTEHAFWAAGPYVETRVNFDYVTTTAAVSWRHSSYRALDPFWGLKREDKALYASVNVELERLRFRGFAPSLSVYCDANRSNIKFYRSTDCGVMSSLTRLY